MIKIKNLNYKYDNNEVLNNINLEIQEGDVVSIIGESGCGKSTLLKLLLKSIYPDKGEIILNKNEKELFAYMPQGDLLMPWYNTIENAGIPLKINKKSKDEIRSEVSKYLKEFNLEGIEEKYPNELSGGMKQRVAFLRTILCNKEVFLLDEPFGALDMITKANMYEWLIGLYDKYYKTMIFITHDIDEAIFLSTKIVILGGKPATIKKIVDVNKPMKQRDRLWLLSETEIKKEVIQALQVRYE